MRAQLRGLADTTVSTVREMLTGSEVPAGVRLKAALAVLQSIGTLEPEEIGMTDPAAIKEERMFDLSGLFRWTGEAFLPRMAKVCHATGPLGDERV